MPDEFRGDYTPTSDIFGKFIEGLKMGIALKKDKEERAANAATAQYKTDAENRARRAESMNLDYLTGNRIRSGEEYDIANKMAAQPEMFPQPEQRRFMDEITLGQQPMPSPASTFSVAQGVGIKPRPGLENFKLGEAQTTGVIPFDPRALGVAGYTEDEGPAKEYMANADNITRFAEGRKALSQPSGLNIQTDESGIEYMPGRKLGAQPTIVSAPADPQVLNIPGAEGKFIGYRGRAGENRLVQEQPTTKTIVNTMTGATTTVPKNTEMFTPIGAAQMMETDSKMNATLQGLTRLEGFLNKVPSGRLGGNFASFINYFSGFYPEVGAAKDLGGMLKPMITRVLGGDVGNLAVAEQAAAGRLTEGLISATAQERKNAFATLRGLAAYRKEANKARKENDMGIWGAPLTEALSKNPQWVRFKQAYDTGDFAEAAKFAPSRVATQQPAQQPVQQQPQVKDAW